MKIVLSAILGAIALISVAIAITRNDVLYARHLQVNGVVSAIEWKSTNHVLPKISIHEDDGRTVVISHYSIALKATDIKVGDDLQKRRDSNYCLINGNRIQFSRYLGPESLVDMLAYLYRQVRRCQ
jgi:hypothetical protein